MAKPSIQTIKKEFGHGRACDKTTAAKKIQLLVNSSTEEDARSKIAALIWVFSGEDWNTLDNKAIDLLDCSG